jgi:hypothetical protein
VLPIQFQLHTVNHHSIVFQVNSRPNARILSMRSKELEEEGFIKCIEDGQKSPLIMCVFTLCKLSIGAFYEDIKAVGSKIS